MAHRHEKPYDIVVFGATGYTGKYVAEELAKVADFHNIKWAVAGRNRVKLNEAITEVRRLLQDESLARDVGIIVADVGDPDSLANMCRQTKLLLNCVGPYTFHGEVVVRECIANGTHVVDISGEFQYLEKTQAKYFAEAKKSEVYVVQSCGFDSIPADLGTAILKKKFNDDIGCMQKVDIYLKFIAGPEGNVLNIGTWHSIVYAIKPMLFEKKKVRDDLVEAVFPKDEVVYKENPLSVSISYHKENWCLGVTTPDTAVVQRTQLSDFEFYNKPPVKQINTYLCLESILYVMGIICMAPIIGLLSLFSFGRYILENYPSYFSFGFFTNKGPSRSQVLGSGVSLDLCASGPGYLADDQNARDADEDPQIRELSTETKELSLKVHGPNAAYLLTSISMVHSGIVILEEADKLPFKGGVFTPGSAFIGTTLVDRLKSRGIKFELTE